jgi:Uma2 family endonuclease
MTVKSPSFRFTVDQYHRMIDTGILTEDDRVELIRGEIVPKMPIGPRHAKCVRRITQAFSDRLRRTALLGAGDPISLADSEPEPDVSLLRPTPDEYESGHPTPADIFLVVEVADTSWDRDFDEKGPLYAENAIPEYWIVNLNDDTVHVFRGPRPDGTWASAQQFTRGGTVTVAVLPGVSVAVTDILP